MKPKKKRNGLNLTLFQQENRGYLPHCYTNKGCESDSNATLSMEE